jgi:branched-chain amino acid transport system ATP-binding protein
MRSELNGAVLVCSGLDAGYNGNPVVRDFTLSIRPRTVLALLGPNGAGKTTVLLTLAGLIPRIGGTVTIDGSEIGKANPAAISRQGLVLVPDDRSLFTTLSVRENLQLGKRKGGPEIDHIMSIFPELAKRLDISAGLLSGGEQQMLAIGRAIMQRPRVLLIDELSMGLAPVIVQNLLPIVRKIADDTDAAVVLVEQHVHLALGIADQAIVLVHGRIALAGTAAELLDDSTRLEAAYLGG